MRYWYYVVGSPQEDGRQTILPACNTEEEAYTKAYQEMDTADFVIRRFSTPTLAKVTSMIKAQRLDSTCNLGQALQRARHQAPNADG